MECNFTAEKPRKIDFTLMATMPLEDWLKVRKSLNESKISPSYPVHELIRKIDDMAIQAERVFCPGLKES